VELLWLRRPGAMTTSQLAERRDELTQAFAAVPASDPGRARLERQLAEVVGEQEARVRSERASKERLRGQASGG
jgi:hypothetical protein